MPLSKKTRKDPNLGLNASGRESEEGEGGGRPVVLLVRISLPGQKVVKKNPHSEISLSPSSTSEALGFPTCLFPFILQALHIPTKAKKMI